jgi:WD40 repeat protein
VHLEVFDLASKSPGQPAWQVDVVSNPRRLAFSPRGDQLVVADLMRVLLLYPVAGGEPLRLVAEDRHTDTLTRPLSHGSSIRAAVFSQDGSTLLSASANDDDSQPELRCWDAATGAEIVEWRQAPPSLAPRWLALSPHGFLLVGSQERFEVRVWPTDAR